jgi:dolichol-phosphate mannosyltransferase
MTGNGQTEGARASADRAALGPLWLVLPTYQEIENIEPALRAVHAALSTCDLPEFRILVVDDSSPDGTAERARELQAELPEVEVLVRPQRQGLGRAYVHGFTHAVAHGADVLLQMDADGSHAPEQLPRLLAALAGADVVLGSRWVPGGEVVNWPRHREVLSRGANQYVRLWLGLDLHDATGGFRAYRRSVLEALDLATVASVGYCFQVDLARRAVQAGFRVVEVPITFAERERGESKMSGAIIREALWRVTVWGLESRCASAVRRGCHLLGRQPDEPARAPGR